MFRRIALAGIFAALTLTAFSCGKKDEEPQASGQQYPVRLVTLDPGHFHAALVQKTAYKEINPTVHVYAPAGEELNEHLKRIESYNKRAENPTNWVENVYTGEDFLARMLADKAGNVVVLSGNNQKKAEYIKACIDGGYNILADKPMCIDTAGFDVLEGAMDAAQKKGLLLYDIMTERSEITTILQKALMHNGDVFGELVAGSESEPAVTKESVHHFFKYVSGAALKRPAWFFDTAQQGEGIIDVTTHLLDLVIWECFPGQLIDYHLDIEVLGAVRRPTRIIREQFKKTTGLDDFPDYLKGKVNAQGELDCYANGEITCRIKGICSKVSVVWNFEAPQGAGDTHYSVVRGTKADVVIRQGKEQNYRPELYVEPKSGGDEVETALVRFIGEIQESYPGVSMEEDGKAWRLVIPAEYRIGHEEHFAQVMERFLGYLKQGRMPDWEVAYMKAKYYTTTKALDMATK